MQQNFLLNEGYQSGKIFFQKGDRQYIYTKNKKFLDLSCCAGTLILGHNSYIFKKSLRNVIKNKISNFAALNQQASIYSKTLNKMLPKYSKFIMCNSGTESVSKALRICRAVTKKRLVISISGSWHGSVDQLLYNANKNLKPIKISDGLNQDEKKNIIYVPYNDIKKTIKILNKVKSKIACILIEPIQGSLPNDVSYNYLKKLSDYSKQNKILLVFDEMITGVRTSCKTVQEIYKIKPDISTFGKVFGGGMPIGFIALSNKISEEIFSKNIKVHFGGTFTSNPFAMYSANETLKFVIKNKKKIFKKIEKFSRKFQEEINNFCIKNRIDVRVYRFQSMLRLIYSGKDVLNRSQRDQVERLKNTKTIKFKNLLLKNKIFYPNNGIIFFSYQSSQKNLNYVIRIFKSSLFKVF